MKRLCAALLLFLGLAGAALAENAVGPSNAILCNKSIAVAAGSSSITQVVAAITGQAINFCGWSVTNTGATGTFSVQTGTGTNCGTNTVTVVPALSITSTAPATDHVSTAWLTSPISSELCWTPSVATISAIFYYSQF
jgi:hypothetical protein